MNEFEKYAQEVLDQLDRKKSPDEEALNKAPWSDWDESVDFSNTDIGGIWGDDVGRGNPLSPEESEAAAGGVARKGVEALAFYKSYRFKARKPFPGMWGIFVFDWALDYLRDDLLSYQPHLAPWEARRWGWQKIHFHELYHFKTDAWTFAQESSIGKPLYENYLKKVYGRYAPGLEVVEESLANRSVYWRSLGKNIMAPVKEWLYDFMLRQPGAYAMFKMTSSKYLDAKSILASQIINGNRWRKGMKLEALGHWLNEGNNRITKPHLCPNQIIYGTSVWDIPALIKPNGKELKDFLFKYLNAKTEGRTDHDKVVLDNGEKAKVPNKHSELDRLKTREFKNLLRKAGMGTKEYIAERAATNIWKRKVPRQPPLPAIS